MFAPAAAHLATGVAIGELGPRSTPQTSCASTCRSPGSASRRSRRPSSSVDRFGNVATNVRRPHIEALGLANGDRVEVRLALDRYYAVVAGTFADAAAGELILYEDSYGLVTLAISHGDAARLTGVAPGDELRIART